MHAPPSSSTGDDARATQATPALRRESAAGVAPDVGAVVIVLRPTCEREPTLLGELGDSGLRVCVVPDGAQAAAVVRSLAPAVVLLDLRHDEAALAACQQLKRTAQVQVVVIAERAQAARLERELGAHEWLAHPAPPREIATRIRAIVRRRAQAATHSTEGLVLDPDRYSATLDGRPLLLTPAEFRLLALIAAARPRVVSRRELLDAMRVRDGTHERSVDSLVHHLRRKLAVVRPGEQLIRATYGAGYSLHV